MAKSDFCFTYYDGDAARDMAHMNRLERGGYQDLILSQRKFGHLTLAFIKKTLGSDFDEIWIAIEPVLTKSQTETQTETYFIEWLDVSIKKMHAQSSHQSNNGKKGGRPPKVKAIGNPNETQMKPHINPLGDGYEDGNGIEDDNEKWTEDILTEKDFKFSEMAHNELSEVPEPDWIKSHLVKCTREKWTFDTQQKFRQSLIAFLKTCITNKKSQNGIGKKLTAKDRINEGKPFE